MAKWLSMPRRQACAGSFVPPERDVCTIITSYSFDRAAEPPAGTDLTAIAGAKSSHTPRRFVVACTTEIRHNDKMRKTVVLPLFACLVACLFTNGANGHPLSEKHHDRV